MKMAQLVNGTAAARLCENSRGSQRLMALAGVSYQWQWREKLWQPASASQRQYNGGNNQSK
jgi:hypothetical protein